MRSYQMAGYHVNMDQLSCQCASDIAYTAQYITSNNIHRHNSKTIRSLQTCPCMCSRNRAVVTASRQNSTSSTRIVKLTIWLACGFYWSVCCGSSRSRTYPGSGGGTLCKARRPSWPSHYTGLRMRRGDFSPVSVRTGTLRQGIRRMKPVEHNRI